MIELFDDNFGLSKVEILRKMALQLGVDYDVGEILVTRDGRDFLLYIYEPLSSGRVGPPLFFEIKTKIPCPHQSFAIRKSDLMNWVVEHILFMPDYQVGDKEFDSKFYIKVENKFWGDRLFSNNKIRFNISNILANEFDLVRSEDGFLKTIKYIKPYKYPEAGIINDSIDLMDGVISELKSI